MDDQEMTFATLPNPEPAGAAAAPAAVELTQIGAEISGAIRSLVDEQPGRLNELAALMNSAGRIFVLGAGRSGLALRMTAMRLMHLGLTVHVVGDVTTPAIAEGDVLLTASGSGTTGGIVRAAEQAASVGAKVGVITTADSSPLAVIATVVVTVAAADKRDRSAVASRQYAGSLFEQTVVLIGDAIFDALWRSDAQSAEELWARHANLE